MQTVPLLAEPLCDRHRHARRGRASWALTARPTPAPGRLPAAPPRPTTPCRPTRWPTRCAACSAPAPGTTSPRRPPRPVAGTVFMRGYAGLTDVTWSGQANSFAASRDLAFLEGLERYAGTHRRTPGDLRVASYDSLVAGGEAALDPRDLRAVRAGDLPRRPDGPPVRPRPARSPGCAATRCAAASRSWSPPGSPTTARAPAPTASSSSAPTAAPSAAAWRRRSCSACSNSSSATPSCSAGTATRRCTRSTSTRATARRSAR